MVGTPHATSLSSLPPHPPRAVHDAADMVAILVAGAYVALFYAFTATTYLASPHSPDLRKLTLSAMNDVAKRSRYFEQKFYQFVGWGRPETQSPVGM